jgi:hypothetical protein
MVTIMIPQIRFSDRPLTFMSLLPYVTVQTRDYSVLRQQAVVLIILTLTRVKLMPFFKHIRVEADISVPIVAAPAPER